MARPAATDDTSLKRLGGGRWQTRDERFTIEPQSGTWVVVDAEQTDDLGLPLVRGPFRSLGDAKEAIGGARSAPPAASPLAERLARPRAKPDAPPTARGSRGRVTASPPTAKPKASSRPTARDEPPAEPSWIGALDPEPRRHARRLIARLEAAGAPDPEGMARRDIVGEVPAVASFAVERALAKLEPDGDAEAVAALLVEGRDEELGVRWRLVDGDGRPIRLDRRLRR
jgi:hypothetical protein